MNSCDTVVIHGRSCADGLNLLAKNSDRPLGEAQPLFYAPAKAYAPGQKLRCTHISTTQAAETYAVLGCKPWWIWGFEMGINQFGLAIGNEAQGSRCDAEKEDGLLGMDLLRLGLERAKTAREAIGVITDLLEAYGQNGNASPLFDRRYENSFLLVDPSEIWLLETAGRQWAAKQIPDRAAISNCYSIGTEWDLCSNALETYARDRRWLAPDEPFDFAKAYTAPAIRQTTSTGRWRRLLQKLDGLQDQASVKALLRDHFEGSLMEPRFGPCYGTFVSICMHAMTWDASQTTASWIVKWDPKLGLQGRYAPAIPCCSVYLPIYMTGSLPEAMTRGGEKYDPEALWWRAERLAMAISIDEQRFGEPTRDALSALERGLESAAQRVEKLAREALEKGDEAAANELLGRLMESGCDQLMALTEKLTEDILQKVQALGGLYGPRKEFLESYCQRTGLPL